MNSNRKAGAERTVALLNAIEDELKSMSDADVLEGRDIEALRKRHQNRLAVCLSCRRAGKARSRSFCRKTAKCCAERRPMDGCASS